ncbi:hypothetical protein KUTeg_014014 [Tegillarca granosa]|uniref:RNA helicase n=1 Tax=Tegillarca granosa TaxID=220873 RepID=A0ABQ9EVD1_TEGGR|nr:hypothetical protein KUTeg_014014 [Tegillarca granosa]
MGEINSMYEQLQGLAIHHELILIPLHSTITLEEQARVFEMPRDGRRKVILSTNIAESSITVPDIKYVIDFCLTKNLISDPDTNYTSLQVEWASKANCIQRKGRAGRVTNGRVYRMVPRLFYENCIQDYGIPEMQRCPLEQLILQVKVLDLGEPKAILALALSPPNLDDIEKTILLLKEVGALTTPTLGYGNRHDGQLTFVGRVLADLPVDIRIGKLMVLGYVFGLLPECLIVGAAMSLKSIFSKPFKKHLEAYRHKMDWAMGSCSDCVAILNAYQEWDRKNKMGEFRRTGQKEKDWANKQFLQIRRLKEISELVKELEQRLYKFNIQPPKQQPNYKRNFTTDQEKLLFKLVLCGAFYPNYFLKNEIDEQESLRSMSGQDPFNTVMVKGLPANQGALYKDSLQTQFRDVGHQPSVFFEETRAYISFKWKHEYQGKVHPGVYSAVKLRHLRLPVELTLYSNEEAHALMQKLHQSQAQGGQKRLRSNRISSDSLHNTPRLQVEPPDVTRQAVMLFVTETKSCGHFWAQYGETKNFEDLNAVHIRLNTRNLEMLVGPLALGTYCVAPFTDETTEWYRARVDHVERVFDRNRNMWTEIAEVFFVDYGNTSKVRREDLRFLPEELKRYPFQAVECMLKGIRPSAVKCPDGKWTEEANKKFKAMVSGKQLYGQIYSIVRDVLRLELFEVFGNGTQLFINDELIKMGYADTAEEGFLSKQNHETRQTMATSSATRLAAEASATSENSTYDWINATLVANQGPVLSGKSKRSSKVRLTGPSNPYEMNFYSMTNVGRMRAVKIEPDSVNSVAIDDEPQDPHDRLMCASFVGLNPSGSSMIARDTTIMPLIPGLPSLIALLFAPMAELRTDPDKTRCIGAICGLGEDRHAPGYPAFPDHDMEITFDVKIDIEDIYKINGVRMAINIAIGSQDQICSWGSDAIYKIQDSARKKMMELIQKRRDPVEVMGYKRPYMWNQIDPDDIIYHSLDETTGDCPMLLNLHNCVMLQGDDQEDSDEEQADMNNKEQLIQHAKWLRKIARDNSKRDPVRCLLCRKDFPTRQLMATHLETRTHMNREEALYDS